MQATIASCRRSFGEPPRKLSLFSLWRLRMPRPAWVKESGDVRFKEIFASQKTLLKTGRVVWAATVQANSLLFDSGDEDCPAAVLYSLDPRVDAQPELLQEAASRLFSFKGRKALDPELQTFADKLADEMVIDLKLPVPPSLTSGLRCYYTCIMVHRGHLPDGKLSQGYYPLLAGAEGTDACMILPSKYWPPSLVKRWNTPLQQLPSRELAELARDNPVAAASLNYFADLVGQKAEDWTGEPVPNIVFDPEQGVIRNEGPTGSEPESKPTPTSDPPYDGEKLDDGSDSPSPGPNVIFHQPVQVLHVRGSSESFTSFVGKVHEVLGLFLDQANLGNVGGVMVSCVVKPGQRTRFWIGFQPNPVPPGLTEGLLRGLQTIPPPVVTQGPVAFSVSQILSREAKDRIRFAPLLVDPHRSGPVDAEYGLILTDAEVDKIWPDEPGTPTPENTGLPLQVQNGSRSWTIYVEDKGDAESLMLRAASLANSGDLDGSIATLTRALEIEPENDRAYVNRACARVTKEDYEGALEDLNQALRINPKRMEALVNRSQIRRNRGDLRGAMDDMDRFVELAPDNPMGYSFRAETYFQMGELGKAEEQATLVHEMDPGNPEILDLRGRARLQKGDAKGALADFNEILKRDPSNIGVLLFRAMAMESTGDDHGALQTYGRIVELAPEKGLAHHMRGRLWYRRGNLRQALAEYSESISRDPSSADAYHSRANCRWDSGDLDGALEDHTKAIEINPGLAPAYGDRGGLRVIRGDVAGGIEDCTRAIELDPTYAVAYANRGSGRINAGEYVEAIADLTDAIRLGHDGVGVYLMRAGAQMMSGALEGAVADFEFVVNHAPRNSPLFQEAERRLAEIRKGRN